MVAEVLTMGGFVSALDANRAHNGVSVPAASKGLAALHFECHQLRLEADLLRHTRGKIVLAQ